MHGEASEIAMLVIKNVVLQQRGKMSHTGVGGRQTQWLLDLSVCTKSSNWREGEGDGHHHWQHGGDFSLTPSQEPKSKPVFCCAGSSTLSHTEPLVKAVEEPHWQSWAELFSLPTQKRRGTCQPETAEEPGCQNSPLKREWKNGVSFQ